MHFTRHVLISSILFCVLLLGCESTEITKEDLPKEPTNDSQRCDWFKDQALGMFIHWSVDSQLGSVISHSMVGASEDYLQRFVNELPKTFLPKKFDPEEWARLAKLAGMKYVVFGTKHHSGFCMFDTKTTDFSVMNTPYGKDITHKVVDAFREKGIHVGFYFSPDDFHVLYKQGHDISRRRPEALPTNNPELMRHNKAQLKELLSTYGPIDVLFIDGEPEGLKQLAWRMQPDILITRGAMETPEERIPGKPMPSPWEACFTLGTQWHYKPTNEDYKSGTRLIEMLIETRAKGGNLLLNVGPKPDGEIPIEQTARLRELALWLFINREAIYEIRPWYITNEENIWFTRGKDTDTVYAFVTRMDWPKGERKTVVLKSVRATPQTEVSVLGQSGRVLEYRPEVDPQTTWTQTAEGLSISAMRAQRIYNNSKWPNPVVVKITHAEYAD